MSAPAARSAIRAMWRDGRLRKGLFANNSSSGKSKTRRLPRPTSSRALLVPFLGCACHRRQCGLHGQSPAVPRRLFRRVPAIRLRRASIPRRYWRRPVVQPQPAVDHGGVFGLLYRSPTSRKSSRTMTYTQSSFTNFAMSGIDKRYYGPRSGRRGSSGAASRSTAL